jgi:hypothetical protein
MIFLDTKNIGNALRLNQRKIKLNRIFSKDFNSSNAPDMQMRICNE